MASRPARATRAAWLEGWRDRLATAVTDDTMALRVLRTSLNEGLLEAARREERAAATATAAAAAAAGIEAGAGTAASAAAAASASTAAAGKVPGVYRVLAELFEEAVGDDDARLNAQIGQLTLQELAVLRQLLADAWESASVQPAIRMRDVLARSDATLTTSGVLPAKVPPGARPVAPGPDGGASTSGRKRARIDADKDGAARPARPPPPPLLQVPPKPASAVSAGLARQSTRRPGGQANPLRVSSGGGMQLVMRAPVPSTAAPTSSSKGADLDPDAFSDAEEDDDE